MQRVRPSVDDAPGIVKLKEEELSFVVVVIELVASVVAKEGVDERVPCFAHCSASPYAFAGQPQEDFIEDLFGKAEGV